MPRAPQLASDGTSLTCAREPRAASAPGPASLPPPRRGFWGGSGSSLLGSRLHHLLNKHSLQPLWVQPPTPPPGCPGLARRRGPQCKLSSGILWVMDE